MPKKLNRSTKTAPSFHTTTPAERLRATMAACRVQFTSVVTQKTHTAEKKEQATEAFNAQPSHDTPAKKLVDQAHPAFKAVTAVRGKIGSTWKAMSLRYTEPGVRLIRKDKIKEFDTKMTDLWSELNAAVERLGQAHGEWNAAAVSGVEPLDNPEDLQDTFGNLFAFTWDFPSLEPPDYLRQLCPLIHEQEQALVTRRFEEAVRLAEADFIVELTGLVEHLTERIAGTDDDGTPKVIRESAFVNLFDFFQRFRMLNVQSNGELELLVGQAKEAVIGVGPRDLRRSKVYRVRVTSRLAGVRSLLDKLVVDRPRLRILRDQGEIGGA